MVLKCDFLNFKGYGESSEDEDRDVPSWLPSPSNDPYILRVLKDAYIGSPYDRYINFTAFNIQCSSTRTQQVHVGDFDVPYTSVHMAKLVH